MSHRSAGRLGALLILLGIGAAPLAGQGPVRSAAADAWEIAYATPTAPRQEVGGAALVPPLLSLAIPGLGQHRLDQRRMWVYLGLEALGWALYLDRRGAGADFRERYRDFAWTEARLQLAPRSEGSFDYYETMGQWDRSGAFDTDATTSGVQPETDPSSFNGAVWALAEGLFFPPGPPPPVSDPAYQSALAYYTDRAYGDAFLWDWGGSAADRASFRGLITASDDRFRQATNVLGAVIANHLVSAVDAYVSSNRLRVAVTPEPGPFGARWVVHAALAAGR